MTHRKDRSLIEEVGQLGARVADGELRNLPKHSVLIVLVAAGAVYPLIAGVHLCSRAKAEPVTECVWHVVSCQGDHVYVPLPVTLCDVRA